MFCHFISILDNSTHHAGNLCTHFYYSDFTLNPANTFSCFHPVSDFMMLVKNSSAWCMNNPFFSISSYDSRNSCIGNCKAFLYDSPQVMSSLGFNHIVYLFASLKTRTKSNGQVCHFPPCPKIFLCQNSIN